MSYSREVPCKPGTEVYFVSKNTDTMRYGVHRGVLSSYNITASGEFFTIMQDGMDDEPEFSKVVGHLDEFENFVFFGDDAKQRAEELLHDFEEEYDFDDEER